MAFLPSELYYHDTGSTFDGWRQAVTNAGTNALAEVRLLERMGNPKKLGATVTNFPLDWQSSVASEREGPLTRVFKEFMYVLIREGESHQIMFLGRIYRIDTLYDMQQGGSIIKLEAFDGLAEVRDYGSAGLDEDVWKRYSLNTKRRSQVIEALINESIGVNKTSPLFLADSSANMSTTDRGLGSGTIKRFESSAALAGSDDFINPAKTGSTTILREIAGLASIDPHTSYAAEKDQGYNFYVDPNLTIPKPVSGTWGSQANSYAKNPEMLNYYKRGTRPNLAPENFGLTVKFGDGVTNRTGTPYVGSIMPEKLITASYKFDKPNHEMFTHAVVTYNGRDETEKEEILLTQDMELLYVSAITGFAVSSVPCYGGKDLFYHQNRPEERKTPPARLQWQNSSGQWRIVYAYVHMASATTSSAVTGSSGVDAYESIVIGIKHSDREAFETEMDSMASDSGSLSIPLRVQLYHDGAWKVPGAGSPAVNIDGFSAAPTCTFNASVKAFGKGRTKKLFGIVKPKRIQITKNTGIEAMRQEILGHLFKSGMDIRRGEMALYGPPSYALDFRVASVSGSNITLRPTVGNSNNPINLTLFGIKVGFSVMNFGSDVLFSDSSELSHGFITAFPSTTTLTIAFNTGNMPSVGHFLRVYLPLRAGDLVRVECLQEAILGNHTLTDVDYLERSGSVQTSIRTIGRNEDIPLTTSFGLSSSDFDIKIDAYSAAQDFGWNVNTIPYGQRPFELENIIFTRTDRETISWSSGFIKLGGKYFSIGIGTTDISSVAMNLAKPDGQTTCQTYYIYFDPDVSTTTFQVAPTKNPITVSSSSVTISGTQYVPDSDNVIVAVARAGTTTDKNAEFWMFGNDTQAIFNIDTYFNSPDVFIADGAMTSALQRKGTQPFSSNITFTPATGGTAWHPNGHHSITVGAISGAKTISFADGKTAAIVASTTSLDVSAGESTSSDTIWYIYFDLTSATESGGNYTDVPLAVTTDYSLPNTDNRGLLAMAAVSTTFHASDTAIVGQLVAIQTFSTKIGNVNADNIAANSITANAIQAESVSTGHISGTLAGNKLSIDSGTTFSSGYDPVTKAKTFVVDGPNPPEAISIGDLWINSSDNDKLYRALSIGANEITSGEWEHFDLGLARARADTGVANALTAQGELNDIADDGKITPDEKLGIKILYDAVVGEYTGIVAQASASGIASTAYVADYDALVLYLGTTLANMWSMSATTVLTTYSSTRSAWNTTWKNYYDEKQTLLNAIAGDAETKADTAQTTATAAVDELDDIADDGIITPNEKLTGRLLWNIIVGEYVDIQAKADAASVSKTAYVAAYDALILYLDTTLAVEHQTGHSSPYPQEGVFNVHQMTRSTTITRTDTDGSGTPIWDNRWKGYYDAKQALLDALLADAEAKADSAADAAVLADNKASTKTTTFRQAGVPGEETAPSALAEGDAWIHTGDHKIYVAAGLGKNSWNLRDDAGAINNALTNITGGRILTQAIILKAGGAGNPSNADSILSETATTNNIDGTRILLHNTGIFGYNESTIMFSLAASDGRAMAGAGTIILDDDGLSICTDTSSSGALSNSAIRFKYGTTLGNALGANYIGLRLDEIDALVGSPPARVDNGKTTLSWIQNTGDTLNMNFNSMRLSNVGAINGGGSEGWVKPPVDQSGTAGEYLKISGGSGTMDSPYTTNWGTPGGTSGGHGHSGYAATSHGSHGGEANTDSFKYFAVTGLSSTHTVSADDSTDTITLTGGTNIAITTDPSNNTVIFDHSDHADPHSTSINVDANQLKAVSFQDNANQVITLKTGWALFVNSYNSGASSGYWNNIYATSFEEVSDQRLKTSITDLSNTTSLALIKALQPRTFNRTEGNTDTIHYGLVAQEVETVLDSLSIDKTTVGLLTIPETETTTKLNEADEEYTAINARTLAYTEFIAPLIGAIKELEARIAALEA